MPTPLGHALGGLAAGALVSGGARRSGASGGLHPWTLVGFGVLGMLPDVDFLFNAHRGATHSVTAAVLIALVAALVVRSRPRVWVASGAAYGSHVLLDWLGTDTVAPFGLTALWPFDPGYYQLGSPLFYPVCREYWLAECWRSLAWAVGWELLLLGPLACAAVGWLWWRRQRLARRP